jgi:hypothetical protein
MGHGAWGIEGNNQSKIHACKIHACKIPNTQCQRASVPKDRPEITEMGMYAQAHGPARRQIL